MRDAGLCWRVEHACRRAWPAAHEHASDGWLVRVSGGPTRRTNSVNPLHGARAPIAAIVEPARASLAAIGQPLVVRVPEIAPGIDAELSRLGFGPGESETITLHADLAAGVHAGAPAPARATAQGGDGGGSAALVQVGAPDAAWIAARARLTGWDDAAMQVYRGMLGLIDGPIGFASARVDGAIVAVAYGAIVDDLLVIESVVTAAEARRRGHARRVVAALMDWARSQRTGAACLQVAAANEGAVRLYRALGFDRELYRYHYRRAPD